MRAFRRLSITARITIGSLIVAVIFGTVAVIGVRMGVAAVLYNATVTLLKHDTAPFTETLANHPAQAIGNPGESQAIAVIDPRGIVQETTLPESLRDHTREIASVVNEPGMISTSNADYVTYTATVTTPAGVWRVVAVRNEDSNELVLDRLSIALIIGAIVLVLGFGAASLVLSRAALRPVNSMRRQADHLASGRTEELLPVGPAQDELSALATTLNNLVGGLRASADREKQLVSDASHELRTPLAVLQGELELAELDAGNPDALLRDIRSSHAAVLRLSQLARNLLELTRIEATEHTGSATWRELTDEVADAIDRARMLAPESVALSIDFDYSRGGVPGRVRLFPSDFARILDNLLGNALAAVSDAGSEGKVTAFLAALPQSVRLTVVDSGPGMPDDFIPIALDRFTRAESSRAERPGGGLGLSIVAALVSSAGGTIALENAPGAGLRVAIELPLSQDES